MAAHATVPAGVLTDRLSRTRALAIALLLWSVAMLSTGAAATFAILLGSRAFLGVVQAVAGPAVPSLAGDVVGAGQRSRAMAVVDSGAVVGMGIGYVVAGLATALLNWRWAFLALTPVAGALALILARSKEPDRAGSHDRTEPLSLREAAAVVLRIRTNVLAIVASAIGQFFFAGLSTFAVVYVTEQYGISATQADLGLPLITVGSLAGLYGGARLGDVLHSRGHRAGRVWVAAAANVLAAGFALPAILTRSLIFAAPMIMAGVAFLNAATPTLDAIRLDVIPPDLRGRSEAIRTVVLTIFEGGAPLTFGFLADHLDGGGRAGLQAAFLVTLPAVALGGLLIAAATPFYGREAKAESSRDNQTGASDAG